MGGHTPPETIFNISAFSSRFFSETSARDCRNVKNVNSKFWMLKSVLRNVKKFKRFSNHWGPYGPMVRKTFNIS